MTRIAVLKSAGDGGLAIGDADGDTWPEIYSMRNGWPDPDTLVGFRRTGVNQYERVILKALYNGGAPWCFGDGDNDGLSELMCEADGVVVLESRDRHSLPTDSVWSDSSITGSMHWPQYADLDLDGHKEIAASVSGSGIRIYENTGDDAYESVATLPLLGPGDAGGFAVADFDRNGRPDLVFGSTFSTLFIYQWTGADNQYAISAICTTETEENYALATAPHLDKDSWPRFVVVGRCTTDLVHQVMVYKATGPGQYRPVWKHRMDIPWISDYLVCAGDVDGDQTDEIAVVSSGSLLLFRNVAPDSYELAWQIDSGCAWCPVIITDVNRDNRAELIFSVQDHIVIYEDTSGLTQISERDATQPPQGVSVTPAVVRMGTSARFSGLTEKSELSLYTVGGQLIRKQALGPSTTWTWNLTDQHGRRIPAGTYFAVLRSRDQTTRTKLCIVD